MITRDADVRALGFETWEEYVLAIYRQQEEHWKTMDFRLGAPGSGLRFQVKMLHLNSYAKAQE